MKLEKGTKVIVTAKKYGHGFNIGDEVFFASFIGTDRFGDHYDLTNGTDTWSLCETEFEVIPNEVKPKIDLEYWRWEYAGRAMQGTNMEMYANTFGDKWAEKVATDSVYMADTLIKELQKEKA